ncbi:multi drug resistance-associated protein MRP [Hesseltinella vesiculosa]|uniref:Multi drug resistance-associated protein MRP n=1 Tax=Hesseltinella vesiculosa TaxID=101127 RepID=A0A1X2G4F9_9FUNG|nr:multi drug resistance-associated protein MRP [Hesseltinella vesiculosa]
MNGLIQCHDPEGWGPLSSEREPDFTPCFEDWVLLNVPVVYMLTAGVIRWFKIHKRQPFASYRNWHYFTKMFVLVLLLLTLLAVPFQAPELQTRSYTDALILVFVIVLHHYEYTRSRVQSGVLLFFWLFYVLVHGAKLRTQWLVEDPARGVCSFVLAMACLMFFLELKRRPKCQAIALEEDEKEVTPELDSHIFSRITFMWLNPLIRLGTEKHLAQEDLWPLRNGEEADELSIKFQAIWGEELKRKNPSLARALLKLCGWPYVFAGAVKIIKDVLQYTQPLLLKQLIIWISSYSTDSPLPAHQGILIAVCMFAASMIQTICFHQYFHLSTAASIKIRGALVSAIYRKTLVLDNESRHTATVGEIVNYMAVDTARIMDLAPNLHHLWNSPFQIIVALYFLYQTMGASTFAGVFLLILVIPINGIIAKTMRKYQKRQMKNKDQRIKLMNELLNGIKVIKLYAWENPFISKINEVRNRQELATLRKLGYVSSVQSMTMASTPFYVTLATFAMYIAISPEPLTTEVAFVTISIFGMLQFPLTWFPDIVSSAIEAYVSVIRIQDYLLNKENDPHAITHIDYRDLPDWTTDMPLVEMQQGTFRWTSTMTQPTLANVDLQVKKGELVAVVGRVGAGKSSLVSALLGDIRKDQGSVTLRGSVAYVPQQPWLMNATVRENIVFGHRFDPVFYEKVLSACSLTMDLKVLADGDMTEIGERGINLSGGQKARISMARALYARADIYLMDDPLSAVDAHVGKHLFENVIGPNGLLKNKARLLVTHALSCLPNTDRVVYLQDGQVILDDKYDSLIGQDNVLTSLLVDYESSGQSSSQSTSASDNEDSGSGTLAEIPIVVEDDDGEDVVDIQQHHQHERRASNASSIKTLRRASYGPATWDLAKTKRSQGELVTAEEGAKGKVDRLVYKTYIEACSWQYLALAVVVQAVSQSCQVGANLWLKDWAGQNDQGALTNGLWYLCIYAMIGTSASIFSSVQTLLMRVFAAIRSARRLHQEMLQSVVHSPMSFFDTTPTGRILNRFSKDQHSIDEILPRMVSNMIRMVPSVLGSVLIIAYSSPLFLVLVLPLFYFYRSIQQQFLAVSRELKRLDSIGRSPVFSHFQESISGVATIRSYGQQDRFIHQNEHHLDRNQKAYYPLHACNRWLSMRLEFLGSIVILAASLLPVIGILTGSVSLDAGLVAVAVTYALTITSSLTWTIRIYCEIENNIVSVERAREYIALPSEKYQGTVSLDPQDPWPQQGTIAFEGYGTQYRPGLPMCLDDVSFTVQSGMKIGIVGRTGSGKSSLALSLFRLLEATHGRIVVDKKVVADLGLTDLRSRLSVIPQDPQIFAGTIRFNLDPFDKADDAALWTALKRAHLHEVVRNMDGQLDAVVFEGGDNFSVGQRQLICLARALLRQSSILVLDEATVRVDVQTDALIQQTIRQEFKECTILTIAHRINTVMDADRVLCMSQGQVIAFDSPDVLLQDPASMFYSLCKEAGLL